MQQRHRIGRPAALAAMLLVACTSGTGREQGEAAGTKDHQEFTGAFGDSAIAEPLPEPSDPVAGATANIPEPPRPVKPTPPGGSRPGASHGGAEPAAERPPMAGTSDTAPMAPSLPGVVDTAPMSRAGPGVVDTAMATPMVDPRTRWRPLGGTLDTAALPVSRPQRATIPARALPGVHR
jgi:hypothetical protein